MRVFRKSFQVKISRIAACCSICVLLTACAVFKSSHDPLESGLKYFLPKTLVKIEIQPLGYAKGLIVAELTTVQGELATTVKHIRVTTTIAGRKYSVLVDDEGKLAEQLVTGLRLKLKMGDEVENFADSSAGFTLQYQASALSTDKVCMGVDSKSLLKFAQASVTDETGNIIVSIAKLAGRLAGPGAFVAGDLAQSALPGELKLTIDPLSAQDRSYVQHAIDTHFPQFKGQYRFAADDAEYFLPDEDEDVEHSGCPEDAICYRTRAPLRLSLNNRVTGARSIAYAKVVNRAVTHHISVDRAFLVEKVTLLKFDEGVLTSVKISKDSEALAAAQLPLTIYDAVLTSALAAPGQFLGEITPGLSTKKYKELLSLYKDNVAAAESIRGSLEKIRKGDLTRQSDSDVIKVTCSNT